MPTPVLDPAVIDTLRQLTPPGEPDVLKEVLQLFLGDVPSRINRLRAACTSGDPTEVQRAAHSLKGSAGNIGAKDMLAICRQLDDRGKAGELSGAGPLLDSLDHEFARVTAEIHRLIA